jgi:hypothetical protein
MAENNGTSAAAAPNSDRADAEAASRARIRALLEKLETASPYESGSLAEQVQRESSKLRSLKQGA